MKSGLDINDYKNYCPASSIPFLGRVMEKVVAAQVTQHIYQNRLHDDLQPAYCVGCITETVLMEIRCDVDKISVDGEDVLFVLLVLSAAFDAIDHEILLHRLETRVGVTGAALRWMGSSLTDRKQAVHIQIYPYL